MLRFLQIIGGVALVALMAWILKTMSSSNDPPARPPTGPRNGSQSGRGELALTAAIILVLMLIFVGCNSFETVDAGHVGVKVLFGEVDTVRALPEGLNFINPFSHVVEMDCRLQKYGAEVKFDCASKDMQDVHVSLIVNARLENARAPEVFQKTGTDYMEKILQPAAAECLKAEMARHSASDILASREAIKKAVQTSITTWVQKYGIQVAELSLTNISFDAQYEAAIRQKQVEEQKALQKTYELQGAEKAAEIAKAAAAGLANAAIEQARGAAEAVKLNADADAYSRRVRAEAEATANEKIAKSLSTADGVRVIDLQRVQRWDGKLPGFVGGGSIPFLFTQPVEGVR